MSHFLNSFNNGFLFGMLSSSPMFGCFGNYWNNFTPFMPSFSLFCNFGWNNYTPMASMQSFSSIGVTNPAYSPSFTPTFGSIDLPPITNNAFSQAMPSSISIWDATNYTQLPSSMQMWDSFNNYNVTNANQVWNNNYFSSATLNNNSTHTSSNTNSKAVTTDVKTTTSLLSITSAESSRNSSKASSLRSKHWTQMTDSEMKELYGNYNRDITVPFSGTAEDLNKFLNKRTNSVLKNQGSAFIAAQNKYGISALVLMAICGIETSYGTKGNAHKGYNVANIEKPKGATYPGRWRRFNSPSECIMELARLLKEKYVTNSGKAGVHLTKLYQVNAKYCPAAETVTNADWAKGVETCISSIQRGIA